MKRPRTPVYWPKMKIRGARRKRLAAQRTQQIIHMRVTVKAAQDRDGLFRYDFVADPNGTHWLKGTGPWRDGFGRVAKPRP